MSHPSRVRGLNVGNDEAVRHFSQVAPFTGAWIERDAITYENNVAHMSHPSRVRGLNAADDNVDYSEQAVAPFTGAWIERSRFRYN